MIENIAICILAWIIPGIVCGIYIAWRDFQADAKECMMAVLLGWIAVILIGLVLLRNALPEKHKVYITNIFTVIDLIDDRGRHWISKLLRKIH